MGENQKRKMSPLVVIVMVLVAVAAVIVIVIGGMYLAGKFGQAKAESDAQSKQDTFIASVAQATALKDPVAVMHAADFICGALSDPKFGKDTPGVDSPYIVAVTNLYMLDKGLPLDDAKVIARMSVQTWCPQYASAIPAKY